MGKKSSVPVLLKRIREVGALAWTDTIFYQGKTLRWGLAWTFTPGISLQQHSSKVAISGLLLEFSKIRYNVRLQIKKRKGLSALTFTLPESSGGICELTTGLGFIESILSSLKVITT